MVFDFQGILVGQFSSPNSKHTFFTRGHFITNPNNALLNGKSLTFAACLMLPEYGYFNGLYLQRLEIHHFSKMISALNFPTSETSEAPAHDMAWLPQIYRSFLLVSKEQLGNAHVSKIKNSPLGILTPRKTHIFQAGTANQPEMSRCKFLCKMVIFHPVMFVFWEINLKNPPRSPGQRGGSPGVSWDWKFHHPSSTKLAGRSC